MAKQRYTVDTFTPPTVDQQAWATFIESRTTKAQFAPHSSLGHAKTAFDGLRNVGMLYELIDGEWVERFRWTKDDKAAACCHKCNKELKYSKKIEWLNTGGNFYIRLSCPRKCTP